MFLKIVNETKVKKSFENTEKKGQKRKHDEVGRVFSAEEIKKKKEERKIQFLKEKAIEKGVN